VTDDCAGSNDFELIAMPEDSGVFVDADSKEFGVRSNDFRQIIPRVSRR